MKSLSSIKKRLQNKFNKYIRLRDAGKPCISCGQYRTLEAGHYIAVGYCEHLRYELDNCHGQCKSCNSFKSGNLVFYRINLVQRIGEERVKALEEKALMFKRGVHKWDRFDLEEKEKEINQLLKEWKS